jgi:hypothetical protein
VGFNNVILNRHSAHGAILSIFELLFPSHDRSNLHWYIYIDITIVFFKTSRFRLVLVEYQKKLKFFLQTSNLHQYHPKFTKTRHSMIQRLRERNTQSVLLANHTQGLIEAIQQNQLVEYISLTRSSNCNQESTSFLIVDERMKKQNPKTNIPNTRGHCVTLSICRFKVSNYSLTIQRPRFHCVDIKVDHTHIRP